MFHLRKGSSGDKDTSLMTYVGIGIIFVVAILVTTVLK